MKRSPFGVGQIAALAARALGDQHARRRRCRSGGTGRTPCPAAAGRRAAPSRRRRRCRCGPRSRRNRRGRSRRSPAPPPARGSGGSSRRPGTARSTPRQAPSSMIRSMREIFDEEVGVVLQALLVERVEHRVAGAVGGGAGALGGRALAHVLHHAAERALVDLAVGGAAERHAGMLQLVDRRRRLADHIFDRVLVAEPVRALDGVVHVPGPVVRPHVAEAGGDPALRGDGVAAGREDLGDAGGLEARLGRAHRRAQARAAGADDHDVIGVVDDLVGRLKRRLRRRFGPARTAPARRRRPRGTAARC